VQVVGHPDHNQINPGQGQELPIIGERLRNFELGGELGHMLPLWRSRGDDLRMGAPVQSIRMNGGYEL
jgi:hypothetical protein